MVENNKPTWQTILGEIHKQNLEDLRNNKAWIETIQPSSNQDMYWEMCDQLAAIMESTNTHEFTMTPEMRFKKRKPLICYRYEDGTVKIRTQEYNERCVDKW